MFSIKLKYFSKCVIFFFVYLFNVFNSYSQIIKSDSEKKKKIVNSTIGSYISYNVNGSNLLIKTTGGSVSVQAYNGQSIRITYFDTVYTALDSGYSLIGKPENIIPTVINRDEYLEYLIGNVKAVILKNPIRINFSVNNKLILEEEDGYLETGIYKTLQFKLKPEESIFGSGSRAIGTDRRGQKLQNYHRAQYGYTLGEKNINISIPLFLSSNVYGLYLENYGAGYFDIGKTDTNVFELGSESGRMSYFFISGNSYDNILTNYTYLTGRQPIPPRWAMGYIQSRFGYKTREEVSNVISQMQKEGFPMDAIVLDLYWFGPITAMGNLTWDTVAFPKPVQMLEEFNRMGVKTILITETFVNEKSDNFNYIKDNNLATTDSLGKPYLISDFWTGPSLLVDIFKPETKNWMWNYYKKYTSQGVAGWWCDLGEPEKHPDQIRHVNGKARDLHNVYPQEWSKLISDGYKKDFPEQRLFNLARTGYAGFQRFSTFPWSGDILREFSGLKAQIPIMTGMSMSGHGYMHSDLGGFAMGKRDQELFIRWIEFGTFTPIMRPHGAFEIPSEPIFWNDTVKNIVKQYANLRYKLLPYNYSLCWQNASSGTPLAKPLNYFDPSNKKLIVINDQFFWGDDFMVAPVINKGETSRKVEFPSGKWINFWNNETYTGNLNYRVQAPLETLPLFVRAGSFIPMVAEMKNTENYSTRNLTINYYPDKQLTKSNYQMYEDDGKTPDANIKGEYELLQFAGDVRANEIEIKLSRSGNGYLNSPEIRDLIFNIPRISKAPTSISFNKKRIKKYKTYTSFLNTNQGFYYDQINKLLFVKFNWNGMNSKVLIKQPELATDSNSKYD